MCDICISGRSERSCTIYGILDRCAEYDFDIEYLIRICTAAGKILRDLQASVINILISICDRNIRRSVLVIQCYISARRRICGYKCICIIRSHILILFNYLIVSGVLYRNFNGIRISRFDGEVIRFLTIRKSNR